MSEKSSVPNHLGFILDGNRRWAKAQGLPTLEGHQQGAEVLKEISLEAFSAGVKYVSAFVFSTENWRRTEEEVGYLMKLVVRATQEYLKIFDDAGIRIIMLGRKSDLSPEVLAALTKSEEATRHNTKGILSLCFNYGGKEEIVDAVKQLMTDGISPEEVNADAIRKALYAPEVPDVDLMIRTSGELRTSGFMLYRADYAELIFVDKYWPDYTADDLHAALAEYAARQRRFGS